MFSLSKWYGDCIADTGETFVAYCAKLRWGAATVNYGSCLEYREHATPEVSFSLRREMPPKVDREFCRWSSRSLRMHGIWKALHPPIADLVYRSEEGTIEWWCGWPSAHARIRVHGKPLLEGCGYVEHLQMSVPPSHLPIRLLRWGHFIGGNDYAVWIDWQGDYKKSLLFFNGRRESECLIGDQNVTMPGAASITLDQGCVLREGKIGSTALAIVRGAAKLFPSTILGISETKWRSRAVLSRPGKPDVTGWSIHENVEWP